MNRCVKARCRRRIGYISNERNKTRKRNHSYRIVQENVFTRDASSVMFLSHSDKEQGYNWQQLKDQRFVIFVFQ